MSKRYYTVVFEIADEESWKLYGPQFSQSLADQEPVRTGVTVVACGNGDTMTAYDALHEAVFESGQDPDEVIREFCELHDLDAKATIG